ncbi:MAG: FecR domain-containing protein [Bacteriovoracaceae bacterium]|nr:FecR domain-containing protein [Bacteriovoracaceae bacterium]
MKISFLICFSMMNFSLFASDAVISKVRGNSYVLRDKKELKLKVGDELFNGEKIRTEKKSFAQVKFDNGIMNIGPNSEVVLQKIELNETKIVNLVNGHIRSKFSKNKAKDHKLVIKTRSAAMGIRGTDFHLMYNKKNNISTAISYEGNVELSSVNTMNLKKGDNMFGEDKVYIKEGHFSGVYTQNGYVNEPVRFSPKQFQVLKQNDTITLREKKATKPKKEDQKKNSSKSSSDKIAKAHNDYNKKIFKHHESDHGIPSDLLGYTHRDAGKKSGMNLFRPKPGGYLDFKTAIYVSPPEGSRYDPKEDLFYPPEDYGSIDELTGEYIAPFGLILLPLNGFVLASNTAQEGVKIVRENVTKVGKFFWQGAKGAGSKIWDGTKNVGSAITDNTGVAGEIVAKGVGTVSTGVQTVASGVGTVGNTVMDTTGKTLSFMADQMNTYLYEGFLQNIGNVLKSTPILSSFQLNLSNKFTYKSSQRFYIYDQLEEVVNVPSFENHLTFFGAYKKFLSKDFFVRPKFNIIKKSYLRDEIPEVKSLNHYGYKFGLDVGILKNYDKFTLHTYFFFYKAQLRKYSMYKEGHVSYLKDKIFGFSKAIISKKYLASRLDYSYTSFEGGLVEKGNRHEVYLSEIIKIDKTNFFNLELKWSAMKKKFIEDKNSSYGFKLNYHRYLPFHGMKVKPWFSWNKNKTGIDYAQRGKEKTTELGLSFTKSFGHFFSTGFEYYINDIASKSDQFDNRSHNGAINLNIVF